MQARKEFDYSENQHCYAKVRALVSSVGIASCLLRAHLVSAIENEKERTSHEETSSGWPPEMGRPSNIADRETVTENDRFDVTIRVFLFVIIKRSCTRDITALSIN